MAEYFEALDRFGVAVCALIAMGVTAWRVGKWMGPRVDKVVESHVCFVAKVGNQVERQTDCLMVLAKVQEVHGDKLSEIHRKLIGS
ncbi:hypothetical protein UFOVP1004_31 [uncultured Caudovirales phage]|uniref:Uncharacterized protein n=1 Tax=uncultured Caudovirales phage TaxID=2100421 RepID=A0A6J5Q8Q5_9CAUD|nr:hypothetical protein UFOVP1004_31 [uncultured Caudovirales phage]